MTMAMELIRHIAGLYSGKAFKGDLTQIYITGNEIWMAQQILAEQAEGVQGERERFEVEMLELCLPIERDSHGAYVSDHVRHLWSGWELRAALAQPSPKCPVCKDSGIMGHSDLCVACAQPSPVPDQSEVQLGMAELERPDVVAWLVTGVHPNHSAPHAAVDRNGQSARALADHWAERGCAVEIMPLMTVAQHARAVAKWADLFDRAQDSADAARAKVPELERPEALDFKPCHHHAEKIRQRVEEAASVYEAGGSALGYMEDIAESALIVRNGLDELSAQHDRIVEALRADLSTLIEVRNGLVEEIGELHSELADVREERNAAQAKLDELEKQQPVAWVTETDPDVTMGRGINWFPKNVAKLLVGTKLYAAPVAQAGQVPEGYMLITQDQVERHATTAWECPPQSRVVLVSTLKRLHEKNGAAPQPAKGE